MTGLTKVVAVDLVVAGIVPDIAAGRVVTGDLTGDVTSGGEVATGEVPAREIVVEIFRAVGEVVAGITLGCTLPAGSCNLVDMGVGSSCGDCEGIAPIKGASSDNDFSSVPTPNGLSNTNIVCGEKSTRLNKSNSTNLLACNRYV